MTPLAGKLRSLIEAMGPISVADYMAHCLSDPRFGYYMTRDPFGRDGDFITAPEVSQMFGELIAAWFAHAWTAVGKPARPLLVEIGPGRGTLMRDMVRTLNRVAPDLARQAGFHLVETSAKLAALQEKTLAGLDVAFRWHADMVSLPPGPLLIVGNEFFDALPVRQFVRTADGWRERVVGLDEAGELRFAVGAGMLDAAALPPEADGAAPGSIVEVSPVRTAVMQGLCERLSSTGGCALFFDYGSLNASVGDTLQAVRRHEPEPVLANPGEADLTTHVDFAALAAVTEAAGLRARLAEQGEFLLGIGLLERAGRLGADADTEGRETIRAAVERLAGAGQMGRLFKVLAVMPRDVALPPFDR